MKALISLIISATILLMSGCIKEYIDDENKISDNSSSNNNNNSNNNNSNNSNTAVVSDYEKEVIALVNKERANAGLKALETDNSLMTSCDVRAKELATKFAHERPDGTLCFTAITEDYLSGGENIAAGQSSPQAVMTSWMNSPGHKSNILSASYTHIGVGCYNNNGTLCWVQLFIEK